MYITYHRSMAGTFICKLQGRVNNVNFVEARFLIVEL
jgi:hypothetical protein